MSFDNTPDLNKTGLDQTGDYHDTGNYFEEDLKNAELNGKPSDIQGKVEHYCSSDDEYSDTFNRLVTEGFAEKHMIPILWSEEMDSAPSQRSKWISDLMDEIKKRWPQTTDNTGYFATSICVSSDLKMAASQKPFFLASVVLV